MMSKLVPRKLGDFEARVTDNPKHKAPIPLFPEPDSTEGVLAPVKVKLRRNPEQPKSELYEKFYTPWMGHTVEGFCKFRAMLDEYTSNAPLTNVNERVSAVSILLSGTPLANWQNVLSALPEGHSWTEKSFDDALMSLALKYCSTSARQEQKGFMKRRLGLPNNYLTATLLNR